jgi:hypothetical protein
MFQNLIFSLIQFSVSLVLFHNFLKLSFFLSQVHKSKKPQMGIALYLYNSIAQYTANLYLHFEADVHMHRDIHIVMCMSDYRWGLNW